MHKDSKKPKEDTNKYTRLNGARFARLLGAEAGKPPCLYLPKPVLKSISSLR